MIRFYLQLMVPLTVVAIAHPLSAKPVGNIDFNRDVRPILSQNCFACHGPDAHDRKGKLGLDTEEGSRKAITPGDIEDSEFFYRITTSDEDDRMPPSDHGKALKKTEVEILRAWIEQGAKYAEPWAYVPPKKSTCTSRRRRLANHMDRRIHPPTSQQGGLGAFS